METINFKIRLALYGIEDGNQYFLDEHLDEVTELNIFDCEFNWIADSRLWNKLYLGFNDDDVIMDVKYEKGLYNITLIAADKFDKHVTVLDSYTNPSLITRTLLDWVKISINGQISDGIGENEIGSCIFKNTECNVWFSSFITDEPVDKYGFLINEPIHIETNIDVIDKYSLPEYINNYKELLTQYRECFDSNNKIINKEKAYALSESMEELRNKNMEYMINALKNYRF